MEEKKARKNWMILEETGRNRKKQEGTGRNRKKTGKNRKKKKHYRKKP